MKYSIILTMTMVLFFCYACNNGASEASEASILDGYRIIKKGKFIDLSHSFEPGIPHWHGFPDERRKVLYSHDKGEGTLGSGFFAEEFTIVGQWGTHVDPPNHFIKNGRSIDQITPEELILPLIVINVHKQVMKDNDYVLSIDDVLDWERKYGKIANNAFVVMRSDWSKRWPDVSKIENIDSSGIAHYPGWSIEALSFLVSERNITAIGHETTDTDPGILTSKGDYSSEVFILNSDRYQIEMLNNVDLLPEYGGVAFISFPKPKGGSGFPARVIAVVPKNE